MKQQVLIEVCADGIDSAIAAQKGGAHRIELCSALSIGGLTPSKGLMESVISCLKIPVNVLIRPREGDFLYSSSEFNVIQSDIVAAKEAGASGIVIGLLNSDGTVDTLRMKELTDLCRPMSVTFHRAFDMTKDPQEALEQIIKLGCDRILTSGGYISAFAGKIMIASLVKKANNRIVIMAGAGINESNFMELAHTTGCPEYHLSASGRRSGEMNFMNKQLSAVFPDSYPITDIHKVEAICKLAASL